jgi:protein-disulfide isomerase
VKYAKQLGMDPVQFKKDMDAGKHADIVQQDRSDGEALKINSTPTIFINGKIKLNSVPFPVLDGIVQQELKAAKK